MPRATVKIIIKTIRENEKYVNSEPEDGRPPRRRGFIAVCSKPIWNPDKYISKLGPTVMMAIIITVSYSTYENIRLLVIYL